MFEAISSFRISSEIFCQHLNGYSCGDTSKFQVLVNLIHYPAIATGRIYIAMRFCQNKKNLSAITTCIRCCLETYST